MHIGYVIAPYIIIIPKRNDPSGAGRQHVPPAQPPQRRRRAAASTRDRYLDLCLPSSIIMRVPIGRYIHIGFMGKLTEVHGGYIYLFRPSGHWRQ